MAKGGAALAMAGWEDSMIDVVVVVARIVVIGARTTWRRRNSCREDSWLLVNGDVFVAAA